MTAAHGAWTFFVQRLNFAEILGMTSDRGSHASSRITLLLKAQLSTTSSEQT